MAKLGTVKWVTQSRGRLGLVDKLTIVAQGVRAKAEAKKLTKAGVKLRHREIEDILPPDSAIAREALAMCEEASAPFLFNHCLRAYYWARLLDDGSRSFDDEATFVALMLHDMGLTDAHRLSGRAQQCFTAVGAGMADDLAHRHEWTDKRAELAANAITLHLNVVIGDVHGREAQLVRVGSGADVAGLGLGVLQADQVHAVCSKHPRLNMKQEMISVLDNEAHHRSGCRIAFMNQKLGFRNLITKTPVFTE